MSIHLCRTVTVMLLTIVSSGTGTFVFHVVAAGSQSTEPAKPVAAIESYLRPYSSLDICESDTDGFIINGQDFQDKDSAAQAAKEAYDKQAITDFIQQLGDDSYNKREEADKRLAAIGAPALEALRAASKENSDPEIRQRAADLVRIIGASLISQVRSFTGHKATVSPYVSRVAVTPDGRHIVSSGDDALRLWEAATGKLVMTFGTAKLNQHYMSLAVTPDGRRVVAGCNDKVVRVFDLSSGKSLQELVGHTTAVWGVALSADGKQLFSGSWDKSLRLWDLDTFREIRTFEKVTDNIRSVAFSPAGKIAAAGHCIKTNGPAVVRLWDTDEGKEIRTLAGPGMEITSVAFSPDGKTVLAASYDRKIYLWDVATGKEVMRFNGHIHRVTHAVFTPDGRRVVSCAEFDPTVRVFDVATGRQLFVSESVPGGFLTVAVLPDGRHCVTSGRDGVVRLWEWNT